MSRGISAKLASLVPRDEIEMMMISCGTQVTMDARGMRDECGHEIEVVHSVAAHAAVDRLIAINRLHAPDHEGFISRCQYDGERWPCLTLRVGTT